MPNALLLLGGVVFLGSLAYHLVKWIFVGIG